MIARPTLATAGKIAKAAEDTLETAVMTYRPALVSILTLAAFGGAAYAADQAATAPKISPAEAAAEKDVGKLSKDGAAAFRDLHLTRIAIFEADPSRAKTLIAQAKSELGEAKSDETVFNKAEADLKVPPSANAAPKTGGEDTASKTATADADAKKPIEWLPVDGQLTLGDDFVATPQKASAVTDANKSLANGDQKGAIEKLRLADVNVRFTMAVLPLGKTTTDVDQAATLINDGKYYEANAVLKQAEDGLRLDVVDVNAPAMPPKSTTATPAPATKDQGGAVVPKTTK